MKTTEQFPRSQGNHNNDELFNDLRIEAKKAHLEAQKKLKKHRKYGNEEVKEKVKKLDDKLEECYCEVLNSIEEARKNGDTSEARKSEIAIEISRLPTIASFEKKRLSP